MFRQLQSRMNDRSREKCEYRPGITIYFCSLHRRRHADLRIIDLHRGRNMGIVGNPIGNGTDFGYYTKVSQFFPLDIHFHSP